MKVTVYPDDGSNPVVLGDDSAGDYISAELPSQSRITTAVPLYQADFQAVFSGGNRLNQFQFITERVHADFSAAAAFKFQHADAVPVQALVEITQGKVSRWLKSAVIPEVRCIKHDGITTIFSYSILGGQFLTKNPNQ